MSALTVALDCIRPYACQQSGAQVRRWTPTPPRRILLPVPRPELQPAAEMNEMPLPPSQRKLIFPAAVSLAALLAAGLLWLARGDLSPLPTYGAVPDFTLTDARGRAVGRKDLAGKVWVADLIFTRCTDTCPL